MITTMPDEEVTHWINLDAARFLPHHRRGRRRTDREAPSCVVVMRAGHPDDAVEVRAQRLGDRRCVARG
jgi:hypothetical protein